MHERGAPRSRSTSVTPPPRTHERLRPSSQSLFPARATVTTPPRGGTRVPSPIGPRTVVRGPFLRRAAASPRPVSEHVVPEVQRAAGEGVRGVLEGLGDERQEVQLLV